MNAVRCLHSSSLVFRSFSRSYSLKLDKCYINGQWVSAQSGKTYAVTNPANGELIGRVPDCTDEDTLLAISAAREAFPKWKKSTPKERSAILRTVFDLHHKHVDELGQMITDEGGKTISQARIEVLYGASYFEWFAEETRRVFGDIVPPPSSDRQILYMKEPVGVAAIITPWNFPNAMLARKIAPCIAAGCTCVIKPSEETPYSSLAIVKMLEEAGVPPGVVNIVTGSKEKASVIGMAMSKSSDVRLMSFTGSIAVGKILMEQSASTCKKIEMELGGNAPFIVFESADIDLAVEGAIKSKFRHNGQTCICTNRMFIHESIHDEFVEKLERKMKSSLLIGNPSNSETIIGPLINNAGVLKVESQINDAVSKGAKLVTGGKRSDLGSNYFEPTLITGVTEDMQVCDQETFGPLAAVFKFKTEEEAITMANKSKSGLAGYFYSNNYQQIWRVCRELQVGMVGVNEGIISSAEVPAGGVKESGLGREGSHYGMDAYLELKYVCFGNLK